MKKHRKIIIYIAIICFFILLYGLTYIPKQLMQINANEVSKIVIFDGNSGKEIEVTDAEHIVHIVQNMNEVTFQKGKSSVGYMGYRFSTTIYNNKGKALKELIINSPDTIRYKGFFYYAKENQIDYDYINRLVLDQSESE